MQLNKETKETKLVEDKKFTQVLTISKEKFKGASTNGKLPGISVLNAKSTICEKINISLFISVLVNTASVTLFLNIPHIFPYTDESCHLSKVYKYKQWDKQWDNIRI